MDDVKRHEFIMVSSCFRMFCNSTQYLVRKKEKLGVSKAGLGR